MAEHHVHRELDSTHISFPCRIETQLTGIPENEVTEHPRYSMPTIGSLLPSYKNADIELILSAFSKAAFQNIQDLPSTLTAQAVLRNKRARQELAHVFGPGESANTGTSCIAQLLITSIVPLNVSAL